MKRKISLFLAAILLVGMMPIQAFAAEIPAEALGQTTMAEIQPPVEAAPEYVAAETSDMAYEASDALAVDDAATVSEQYIQNQINSGKKEIALGANVVLNNNFTLPAGIFLRFNGYTITVPSGKTLTVNGQLGHWGDSGGLIVESGGSVVNLGYIGTAGILDIRGSYEGNMVYTTSYRSGAVINGIPNSKIWMIHVVDKGDPNADHGDLFLESLNRINSTDYGHYSLLLHGSMVLPCDLVIPENVLFCLESQSFTLTIPAGRKITNYGEFRTYENQTVVNYGVVENAGSMNIQGAWLGNQPVKAKMTQDQLEAAMAGAEYYELKSEVVLERNMTISKWFSIRPDAKLVVPRGVKLTIDRTSMMVIAGGTLEIQGEYEIIQPDEGLNHITCCYENGVLANVTGVDYKDMALDCIVYNDMQLVQGLQQVNSTNYARDFVEIYQNVTLTSNGVIPENCFMHLYNSASMTIPFGKMLVNNGELYVWEGQTLQNNGVIENNRVIVTQGKLINAGQITVNDGAELVVDEMGYAKNSGTVTTYGNVIQLGTWEGNDAVQMKMTQAQLEAAIAAAADNGEYILEKDFTLERDLVIDGTNVGLYVNGTLTVPKGMTLTIGNGGYMTVGEDGTLDVQGEIKVNYTNGWPCRVNMFYWNGKVSTVKGVPQEYIVMNCPVSNEAELVKALEYLSGKTFGFQIVRVNNSITLTRDITVPKNTSLRLQNGAILTIPSGRTFTHNGAEIQLREGHAIRNNGVIENNSDFYISGTGKMVNNGTFKNNGKLHMNGIWEGNAPVAPHTHTYTEKVTLPTCTTKGYTTFTCACGDSYTGNETKAQGHKYKDGTCSVCGAADPDYVKPTEPELVPNADRVAGGNRISTALTTSDKLKEVMGVEKYNTIVVADAMSFPDALSGSYLAAATKAPILLYKEGQASVVKYIQENLASGGKVYVLGGKTSVPDSLMTALSGIDCERVAGSGRLATSLKIIAKADEIRGTKPEQVLICDGRGFADSLSASATGLPILLVNGGGSLNDEQKAYLESVRGAELYVIGGKNSVSEDILIALKAYDADGAERISGAGRELTSVEVAKKFFPEATTAALASSTSFPDGLSGGPVAYAMGAPLLLTRETKESVTADYVNANGIAQGYVIGGTSAVSNTTANKVFGAK